MITYKRHRFPPAIISYAVWLYHRFDLSHRDIEDLLAERGIAVSYEAIRLANHYQFFRQRAFTSWKKAAAL